MLLVSIQWCFQFDNHCFGLKWASVGGATQCEKSQNATEHLLICSHNTVYNSHSFSEAYLKVSSFEAIEIVLKEYFNLSYSEIARTKKNVAKLDQIGVPGYERGGLENWGLIMYGPDYFNRDDQTEEEKFQQVVLMSHEIGHHWIGNLVTMKWWNDLWINEAGFKFHPKIVPIMSKVMMIKSAKGNDGVFGLS